VVAAPSSATGSSNSGSVQVLANATGGDGGTNLNIGSGGAGGSATASAAGSSNSGGANVNSTANATGGAGGTGSVPGSPGAANATASATTVGSGVATANATAVGAGPGLAVASSTSNGASGQSIVASATSPVGGPASALTQTTFGGAVSLPTAINPGQSYSVVNGFVSGPPLMLALGAMGAGYGGTGESLTYQESADFQLSGHGTILLGFLSPVSIGNGFDSSTFQIFINGALFLSQSFNDLASANNFFTHECSISVISRAAALTLSFCTARR
jgi:hypothetical protein